MKTIYQYSLLLLMITSQLHAFSSYDSCDLTDRVELKKHISKSFKVSPLSELSLENRYGKIVIEVWDKSEANFEIDVIVKSSSKNKAQETLDKIGVNFEQNNASLDVRTIIEESKGWFDWSWGNNADMEINYLVKIPSTMQLGIAMKYGNIYLPTYYGETTIDLGYGNLIASDLTRNLGMNLKYGDAKLGCIKDIEMDLSYGNLDISSCENMTLEIKYGKVDMGNSNNLNISSKYSNFSFVTVNSVELVGGYDHLDINEANSVEFENKYSDITIGKLHRNLNVNASYNTSMIKDISTAAGELNFEGKYSSVKIQSKSAYSYEIQGKYISADLNGVTKSETHDGNYSEYIGKKNGGGKAKVTILGDYTNIYLN